MIYNAYKVDEADIDILLDVEDVGGNLLYPGLEIFYNDTDDEYYVTEAWGDEIKKENPGKVSAAVITTAQNNATAGTWPIIKKRKLYPI